MHAGTAKEKLDGLELKIVELSNSVKVINLIPSPIHFEDGTVVPPTYFRPRLSTLKRVTDPPNADTWRSSATAKANYVDLIKADTVPRVEDLEWLKENIPNDVLILCKRATALVYGFPCVTPNYSRRIDDETIAHAIDSFLWASE